MGEITFTPLFTLEAMTEDELYELRRSQVVYMEWCQRRILETGNLEVYMEKIKWASRMTTRIDVALGRS